MTAALAAQPVTGPRLTPTSGANPPYELGTGEFRRCNKICRPSSPVHPNRSIALHRRCDPSRNQISRSLRKVVFIVRTRHANSPDLMSANGAVLAPRRLAKSITRRKNLKAAPILKRESADARELSRVVRYDLQTSPQGTSRKKQVIRPYGRALTVQTRA